MELLLSLDELDLTLPFPNLTAPVLAQVTSSFQTSPGLPEPGLNRRTDPSSLVRNPVSSAAMSSRADNSVKTVGVSHMTKGPLFSWVSVYILSIFLCVL